MIMTDVTVVIPVHNGAAHLAAAIESVFAQTAMPASVIVVDDGSTDATPGVAAQFGSRIRYLRQDNAGAAAARNAGVRRAETSHVAFLDADDLWTTSKLALQLSLLCDTPAMIFGHTVQFASPELSPEEIAALKFDAKPMPAITASALLIRKRDFLTVGPFDESLETGEFIEWYARARDCRVASLIPPDIVVHRRLHRDNHGRKRLDARPDYARALKSVLDRRRKAS